MRYVLQMNTGSFHSCATTAAEATRQLTRCIRALPVDGVIFGWSGERAVNRAVCELLAREGIAAYLWLPVFSELMHPERAKTFVSAASEDARAIRLCRDESFEFVCPSAEENVDLALESFLQLTDGLPVAGAFIDRIRYPSAANFAGALMGCQCAACREACAAAGLDEPALSRLQPEDFRPRSMEKGRYGLTSAAAEKLFAVRRERIDRAAARLCAHFHGRGLRVGLDSFAPALADYVGQDVWNLTEMVDFIKPMMYRRTYAPAGIPFELEALEARCGPGFIARMREVWGADPASAEGCAKQLNMLAAARGDVRPGIEVNAIEQICDADADYIRRSLRDAKAAGCTSAVLSWDILRMPPARVEILARIAGEM